MLLWWRRAGLWSIFDFEAFNPTPRNPFNAETPLTVITPRKPLTPKTSVPYGPKLLNTETPSTLRPEYRKCPGTLTPQTLFEHGLSSAGWPPRKPFMLETVKGSPEHLTPKPQPPKASSKFYSCQVCSATSKTYGPP